MSPSKPRVTPRKPGLSVDPAKAAAFEDQLEHRERSTASDKSTSTPVAQSLTTERRKGLVQRARKGELDRITAYLPVELGEQVRIYCATHRSEMSAVIADALRAWLSERPR